MKIVITALVLSVLFFSSCTDKDTSEYKKVNDWVYSTMIDVYYWYNTIDNHTVPESMYPEDYFHSLLYKQEDKWSYITDDFQALSNDLMGTPVSMGYSPTFGQITGTNDVFMVVEYVYPNSPAQKAGLKRGDLILQINGNQLNIDNYVDLYYAENQTLKFGHVSNGVIYNDAQTLSMKAVQLNINPALFDTLYVENGVKVGYVVITEFVDDAKFIEDVGASLSSLKNRGATELIIDLRYNGGGFINSAQWLASALAPASVVNRKAILTKLNFNDKLETTMDNTDKEYRFVENNVNFDLNRVVFLAAHGTASASELVMIGLDPYMDVIQIGENTYGKYTGMWVIPDTHLPPQHNWAMMPVVMKYANANDFTDFKNGLYPDYQIDDDIVAAYAFGNTNDPMLARALEICTGSVIAKSSVLKSNKITFKEHLYTAKQKNKKNLFVPYNIN